MTRPSDRSLRRRIAAGVMTLGLAVGLLGCGADDPATMVVGLQVGG